MAGSVCLSMDAFGEAPPSPDSHMSCFTPSNPLCARHAPEGCCGVHVVYKPGVGLLDALCAAPSPGCLYLRTCVITSTGVTITAGSGVFPSGQRTDESTVNALFASTSTSHGHLRSACFGAADSCISVWFSTGLCFPGPAHRWNT